MNKKPSHSPVEGTLLFVYGTLKHNFLNPYAKLLQQMSTHSFQALARGELYVFNWYPVAVFDTQSKNQILGECFFIPKAQFHYLFSILDDYESIGYVFPCDEYKRITIEIQASGNNKKYPALTYQHIPVTSKRYFRTKHKKVKVFR